MTNSDSSITDELQGPFLQCNHCGNTSINDFKFCSSCGKKKVVTNVDVGKIEITSDKNFISLLSYCFITIGILAFSQFSEFSSDRITDFFILLAVLAALDLGYGLYNGSSSFMFSTKTLKLSEVFKVVGILSIGGVIVHYLADFLNTTLFEGYEEIQLISGENWWLMLLLVSVYPAFFEEISFRGFLFHNVEKLSNKKSAMIVTSLIFGITHLSFVSLIWHVPLGYYFAHLRAKYNTLWYGVIGHFFYNTFVTLIDLIL